MTNSSISTNDYAGDVSAPTAFSALSQSAIIVDVRTRAEWTFVGLPALAQENLVLCEWQKFPDMDINPTFSEQVTQEILMRCGASEPSEAPDIYFLCRSGVRSRSAAIAMTSAGFARCFNIANGFEGQPDDQGHRGLLNGWKAEKLPWRQN